MPDSPWIGEQEKPPDGPNSHMLMFVFHVETTYVFPPTRCQREKGHQNIVGFSPAGGAVLNDDGSPLVPLASAPLWHPGSFTQN